ncbi:hypothetical protein R3W88_000780 [Solanum pinnatisectum]|uniref:Uncharacterized protein n=1 Tax=Solanum pinnatisectum TaxID=50273 RepID=A0AAV9MI20_9SOLN|nr:hypothetical protein R3W88_000780 [Solanum pinnatisectum]
MTREENLIEELGTNTKPDLRKTSTLRQTRLLHERKTSLVLKDPTTAMRNPCNIGEITRGARQDCATPLPVPGDIQISVQAQAPKWHRNRVHKGRTHSETKLRNYQI